MISINLFEILGFSFGVIAIVFGIKQYAATWPLNIASNIFLAALFWQSGRWLDIVFRAIFIILSFYGWYLWKRQSGENYVKRFGRRIALTATMISIAGAVFGLLILRFRDFNTNWLDVSATALNLSGQFLFARKHIESWYVFIVSDLISAAVYFAWGLYFLVLLSLSILAMCIIDLRYWKSYGEPQRI